MANMFTKTLCDSIPVHLPFLTSPFLLLSCPVSFFFVNSRQRRQVVPNFQFKNINGLISGDFCIPSTVQSLIFKPPKENLLAMDQSPKSQSRERKTMYPKVKVREQDQDDGEELCDQKRGHLMSLKDVQYLSLHDPAKENQFVSPILVARIPKSYVPDLVRDSISAAQGVEKDNKGDQEENRPNVRASSIPRPRAVLSSPDNDAVIGNRNKVKAEHAPASKNHNQGIVQNRLTIQGHIYSGNTINSRKSKGSADHNVNLDERKDAGVKVSSQRRKVKTQRPAWQDP